VHCTVAVIVSKKGAAPHPLLMGPRQTDVSTTCVRQEWSHAVYVRMPALPPGLQRQAELAAKHLRRMDWQRAALGASFASVAVLSVLLYNSYTTNRCCHNRWSLHSA
jgi:hypothetical protein